jgi:hypothetical protein
MVVVLASVRSHNVQIETSEIPKMVAQTVAYGISRVWLFWGLCKALSSRLVLILFGIYTPTDLTIPPCFLSKKIDDKPSITLRKWKT